MKTKQSWAFNSSLNGPSCSAKKIAENRAKLQAQIEATLAGEIEPLYIGRSIEVDELTPRTKHMDKSGNKHRMRRMTRNHSHPR